MTLLYPQTRLSVINRAGIETNDTGQCRAMRVNQAQGKGARRSALVDLASVNATCAADRPLSAACVSDIIHCPFPFSLATRVVALSEFFLAAFLLSAKQKSTFGGNTRGKVNPFLRFIRGRLPVGARLALAYGLTCPCSGLSVALCDGLAV